MYNHRNSINLVNKHLINKQKTLQDFVLMTSYEGFNFIYLESEKDFHTIELLEPPKVKTTYILKKPSQNVNEQNGFL